MPSLTRLSTSFGVSLLSSIEPELLLSATPSDRPLRQPTRTHPPARACPPALRAHGAGKTYCRLVPGDVIELLYDQQGRYAFKVRWRAVA